MPDEWIVIVWWSSRLITDYLILVQYLSNDCLMIVRFKTLDSDDFLIVWWLSDGCLMIDWGFSDNWLMVVWWLSDDWLLVVWWLSDDCLMIIYWSSHDCLMTFHWLFHVVFRRIQPTRTWLLYTLDINQLLVHCKDGQYLRIITLG